MNFVSFDLLFWVTGIRVSYTVWISIIPVTFSAGVDFDLKLSWGWQVR